MRSNCALKAHFVMVGSDKADMISGGIFSAGKVYNLRFAAVNGISKEQHFKVLTFGIAIDTAFAKVDRERSLYQC